MCYYRLNTPLIRFETVNKPTFLFDQVTSKIRRASNARSTNDSRAAICGTWMVLEYRSAGEKRLSCGSSTRLPYSQTDHSGRPDAIKDIVPSHVTTTQVFLAYPSHQKLVDSCAVRVGIPR